MTDLRREPVALPPRSAASHGVPPGARTEPPGLDPFVMRVVEANRERRSWRRRLEWVNDALQDPSVRRSPNNVATLAAYLQFVGTGAVKCEEDGGHYRPSRHAALALDIERQLLEADPRPAPALVRHLLRWLPSHDAPFRRAEPLTRIRDIAHRNDIPQELKQEIKHTLQNKLHRSAGPEDLVTSARLLDRVLGQQGELPSDFIHELTTFHRELEEFFNASSLDRELALLAPSLPERQQQLVRELRACFARRSETPGQENEELLLNRTLRKHLASAFASVGDSTAQHKRILDIKLEQRAFVVLSERSNRLERSSGVAPWPSSLEPLTQALRHLALSGTLEAHCEALSEALEQWSSEAQSEDRERLLRLVALLALAQWIVTRAMDQTLDAFSGPAEQLGTALGLPPERVAAFTEGEIRQSLVFQVSRLVELLTARARRAVGGSAWQAVVPGRAVGRFVGVDTLEQLPPGRGPWIVILQRAFGDETLPPSMAGALVLRELPILSHLCIRARQAGVVMAAGGQDADTPVRLLGQTGWLRVDSTTVEFGEGSLQEPTSPGETSRMSRLAAARGAIIAVDDTPRIELIDLDAAELDRAGPKAYASRRLHELARAPAAGFAAPGGWVIPFGAMEATLALDPRAEHEYGELVERLEEAEGDALLERSRRLREFVLSLTLPRSLLDLIAGVVREGSRYVVRSSGNLEDLAGYSAAGLHDSVVGASGEQVPSAILRVWASLHSLRAATARREISVATRAARMAVMIQPLVPADASFVMFTQSPLSREGNRAYVELAVGLAEVLTSATGEGTPLRIDFDKFTGDFAVLTFPSYPNALKATSALEPTWQAVCYAQVPLVTSRDERCHVVRMLGAVARTLEDAFGSAQDVEGVLVDRALTIVQSRPAVALV